MPAFELFGLTEDPLIEVQVKVVNRPPALLHYFTSTVRAEDCRARLMFFDKKNKAVFHVDCIWTKNGEESIDIPASFYPEVLTLMRIHAVTRDTLIGDGGITVIPPGKYELGLIIDAKGTSSYATTLGTFNYPEDLFQTTTISQNGSFFWSPTSGPSSLRPIRQGNRRRRS